MRTCWFSLELVHKTSDGERSMSTSLLYHGLGVRGYRYVKTEYQGGAIVFTLEQPRERYCCPACGSANVIGRGLSPRRFRAVPWGSRSVFIDLAVPRVECRDCGVVRQVAISFADPRRSYTRAFERYALELLRMMTIQDVARHLGVSWDLVKEIDKRYLARHYARPRLLHVRRIAIDEIAERKGHRYLTLVLDLDTGAVLHVGRGKGGDALVPFWRRLRASGAKIQAVACDMSPAYIDAVVTHLPRAAMVFDRFHVVNLLNDKLSQLRRELHRTLSDTMQKQVLKGVRWLLLKRPENLDARRNERQRLEEALRLNAPLATAYYLKEELGELWEQEDEAAAKAFLLDWIARAEASGVRMLIDFARTLRLHAWGLLAWYAHPISTGPLEGVNNKIKTLKRQAYGYRDREFFALKILALHESKYALVG